MAIIKERKILGKKGAYIASVLRNRINVGSNNIPETYASLSELSTLFELNESQIVNGLINNHLYLVGPFELNSNQEAVHCQDFKALEQFNNPATMYVPSNSTFARKWYTSSKQTYIDRDYFKNSLLPYI